MSAGEAGVSGWGSTVVKTGSHGSSDTHESELSYRRVLQTTNVHIMPKDECRSFYAKDKGVKGYANHPSMLCAGYHPGGQDTCSGKGSMSYASASAVAI